MLLGTDNARDGEGRQLLGWIFDMLDLKARHGHGVNNLLRARRGFQVLLEPGQGEFHLLISNLRAGPEERDPLPRPCRDFPQGGKI